ncbi:MAG: indole-3-glycerol phosphate synthase TrpC [Lachnospiraceae bacterium]|nr:indole-3-glycerol phosphate synthase TrpC [Lachnospiraceae bacterium]
MILDNIAAKTRERIKEKKRQIPMEVIRKQAEDQNQDTGFPFAQALCRSRLADAEKNSFGSENKLDGSKQREIQFICEVKKASPSKGLIAADFPYLQIAKDYEAAGASAISCLTEPYFFQGSDQYLEEIAREVRIPVLRKDFTVDEYMIYEAKILGASAVLLICAILDKVQLKAYLELSHSLGMSALVEAHDEAEVEMALESSAGIIGVNNRNLKTFEVDIYNSIRLRKLVPPEILFVSESGMKTPEDIAALRENGTDAVLIGETLMRSRDKKAMLDTLRGI